VIEKRVCCWRSKTIVYSVDNIMYDWVMYIVHFVS